MKEYTITMTSKGQFTMPVEVRKALEIDEVKNKLRLTFDQENKKVKIERPLSFDEISNLANSYIKPGTPPLLDPRDFYESRESSI